MCNTLIKKTKKNSFLLFSLVSSQISSSLFIPLFLNFSHSSTDGWWRDFKDEDGGGMEGFVFRGEESGGVGRFSGGEEMCEAFENSHLMHWFVDVRNVERGG